MRFTPSNYCGKQVPVYRGTEKLYPSLTGIQQSTRTAIDGMGDIGLPLAGRTPAEGHAVTTIIETDSPFFRRHHSSHILGL